MRMNALIRLALLAAALASPLLAPRAQEPAVAPPPAAAAPEQRFVALAAMLGPSERPEIRGRAGRIDLVLSLEEGAVVEQAALKLAYSTSSALVSERSRLVVTLNQNALAELPLAPRRGATRAELTLPSELLRPGSNLLSLSAVQEHRDGCSRTLIEDLWTRVDPTNSYVTLTLQRSDGPLVLADLGAPNWPLGRDGAPVPVVTVAPVETDAWLRIGGLVAQGLALRTPERPVVVQHRALAPGAADDGPGNASWQPLPFGHHVLVGAAEELAPIIGAEAMAAIDGPWLGVRPPASDGEAIALVVSGRDVDDVLFAAQSFASPTLALAAAPSVTLDRAPPPVAVSAHQVLPGEVYTFAQLADPTAHLAPEPEQRTTITLMLPPDFYVTDNRKAELRLNYGYKANIGAGSGLHVIVNGEYAGLISLESEPGGGIVEAQPVRVPLRLFRPGRNVLSFEPALTNADAALCGAVVDSGPQVGVFSDSTIRLPAVSRVITLPSLGLMTSLAFPFQGDRAAGVVATAYDPATIGAVWTLIGKLAQTARQPLPALSVSFAASEEQPHSLLVGPIDRIDRRLLGRTPVEQITLRPTDADERPPAGGRPQLGLVAQALAQTETPANRPTDRAAWERQVGPIAKPPEGIVARLAAALDRFQEEASHAAAAALPAGWATGAIESAPSFFGDPSKEFDGAAFALASPFARRGTVTIVTAMDPPALERAVAALVQPATWHDLRGDVSVWAVGRPGAAAAQVAARFPLDGPPQGLGQRVLYMNSYLAEHPALWVAAIVLAILLLAALSSLAVRQAGRRH